MSAMHDRLQKHGFLLDLIPYGKDNAVHGNVLDNVLKIDSRARYSMIERARRDGALICSCNDGYYRPETPEEMHIYYETAHKKAITILSTLKATRKVLIACGVKVR